MELDLHGFDRISPSVRSEVSSFTDLGGAPERFAELITMDSLYSVLKESLTGLIRAENSGFYCIHGKIKDSDQQALYNYTERIGELTLGREPNLESRLASSVFVQVAHHQDPNKPLFPNLHRLRIIEPSSSLDFLHVILSSALMTLELIAIPDDDPHYPSVLSFLECAVDEAPNLSTLILGPGRISNQILDISLRYQNLQHLKFLDVEIAITDHLLHAIGSLRLLETLVLRNKGNSTYKCSPAIPAIGGLAISSGQRIDQDLECKESVQIFPTASYAMNEQETIPNRSDLCWGSSPEPPALTVLNEQAASLFQPPLFYGQSRNPSPIDFGRGRSPSLKPDTPFFGWGSSPSYEPGLSPVMNEREIPPQSPIFFGQGRSPSPEIASSAEDGLSKPEPREATVDSPLFRNLRSLDVGGSSSLIEDLIEKASPHNLQELSIDFTKLCEWMPVATAQGPRRVKGEKKACTSNASASQPAQPQMPTPPAPATLVSRSIQKWGHTLVSVSVQNNHTTRFSLPFDVFENLVLRPDMKRLEITGIDIGPIMDGTFDRLKEVVDSKLEVLHLPVHFGAPGISPPRLRDIAEACPRLKSFRCRLLDLSCLPLSFPLSHQLEVLTVSDELDHLNQQSLPNLKLARYLDSIFPDLKSIQTYDENGNNAQQWRFIFTLVKTVCQAVRMDEVQRRQGEAM